MTENYFHLRYPLLGYPRFCNISMWLHTGVTIDANALDIGENLCVAILVSVRVAPFFFVQPMWVGCIITLDNSKKVLEYVTSDCTRLVLQNGRAITANNVYKRIII